MLALISAAVAIVMFFTWLMLIACMYDIRKEAARAARIAHEALGVQADYHLAA